MTQSQNLETLAVMEKLFMNQQFCWAHDCIHFIIWKDFGFGLT